MLTPRPAVAAAAVLVAAGLGGCSGPPSPVSTQASTLTPTAGTVTPTGGAAPRTITMVASGDVLLHPPLWSQARRDAKNQEGYDFSPLLAGVASAVSQADVAICHLETPVAGPSGPLHGYPRFSVPPQIARDLAEAGYDSCSTASNHTIDQGEAGVRRTLDALDAAGLRHAGSYRSRAEHDRVTMLDVSGVKLAHLSYTFSFNGLSRPSGKSWLANLIDVSDIIAEAKRARTAGAQIVVVSLHFGTEYQHQPDAGQTAVARKLLASTDIDVLLGHHAHVVQPFEQIGGKWVAYGMGNEVAHHAQPVDANREGVLARFTFTRTTAQRWQVSRAQARPIWMSFAPDRLVDLVDALADPDLPASRRATFEAAWQRIRGYVLSRGAPVEVVGG